MVIKGDQYNDTAADSGWIGVRRSNMIVFELTMPHRGSWNNKWTGEQDRYIRVRE